MALKETVHAALPGTWKNIRNSLPELQNQVGPNFFPTSLYGEVSVKDTKPLEIDLENFQNALQDRAITDAFMNAASPGVIAQFQPNDYYTDHRSYLYALAEAMQVEYEGIAKAGFVIQIDSPDLALGRHVMFKDKSDSEFVAMVELHIEALNHALENIPAEQLRLHVCWGNYQGPHHCDIEMKKILPAVLKAKPQALSFEGSIQGTVMSGLYFEMQIFRRRRF
ncbi:MAG: hypothetical protein Ct9H300mP28_01180 [Pseudomonadota bacterium]|nr:MAG: hypothetical protein Ct9H300mP28_01180 [Pseudomonadota bacterium]